MTSGAHRSDPPSGWFIALLVAAVLVSLGALAIAARGDGLTIGGGEDEDALATTWTLTEDSASLFAASAGVDDSDDVTGRAVFAPNGEFELRLSGVAGGITCDGTWERSGNQLEATCERTARAGTSSTDAGLTVLTFTLESPSRLVWEEQFIFTPA